MGIVKSFSVISPTNSKARKGLFRAFSLFECFQRRQDLGVFHRV